MWNLKGVSMQQRQHGSFHQAAVLQRGAVHQRQVCEPCGASLRASTRHRLSRCSLRTHKTAHVAVAVLRWGQDMPGVTIASAYELQNTITMTQQRCVSHQPLCKTVACHMLHDADVQLLQVAQGRKGPA